MGNSIIKTRIIPSTPLSKEAKQARKPIDPITAISALQDNVYDPRPRVPNKVVRDPRKPKN